MRATKFTLAAMLLLISVDTVVALDKRPAAPVVDQVDVIVLSHVYDVDARLVFQQFLFCRWYPSEGRHRIDDWRLVRTSQRPVYDARTQLWTLTWVDGTTLRSVRARAYDARHDQYDPELDERSEWPVHWRRLLTEPQRVKSVLRK